MKTETYYDKDGNKVVFIVHKHKSALLNGEVVTRYYKAKRSGGKR